MPEIMKRATFILLSLTGWIGSLLIFFRGAFFSGFAKVVGDPADGQLITSIHEHWFRFLQGKEGWHTLNFFYPVENTLGYSDTFLGTGLVFSLFRFAGLDPYLSLQATLILLATLGFWTIWFWLRKFRQIDAFIAVFCAFLFVIASPVFIGSRNSHIQLLAVWQIPLGLILLEWSLNGFLNGSKRSWLRFCLFTFWLGLFTYSTFYMAFFFGLLCLCAMIACIPVHGYKPCLQFLSIRARKIPILLPGLAVLAAWAVLFLVTYLPPRAEHGGRSFKVALEHLPQPWNLIHHSETSLLWGETWGKLWDYPAANAWELEVGHTPFLFLFGILVFMASRRKGSSTPAMIRIAGWSFIIGSLLVLRLGDLSLWALPYYLLPGSEGIRAAFRFNIILLIPLLLLAAWGFQVLLKRASFLPATTAYLFALVVVLEQLVGYPNTNLDRREYLRLQETAPPPPEELEAFYAIGSPWGGFKHDVPHNTATMLSQYWDLPTLNGRSGLAPGDWKLFSLEGGAAFPGLAPWARAREIDGKVGLFDLDALKWFRIIDFGIRETSPLENVDLLEISPDIFATFGVEGWSGAEIWGIWTEGRVATLVFHPEQNFPAGVQTLEMEATAFLHPNHPTQKIEVYVDGHLLNTLEFSHRSPELTVSFSLPETSTRPEGITFKILTPASPSDVSNATDERVLGLGLKSLMLH